MEAIGVHGHRERWLAGVWGIAAPPPVGVHPDPSAAFRRQGVKPYRPFYAVATGPAWRRVVLTPIGLLIFGGLLWLLVWGSLSTDRALDLPRLLPGAPGSIVGVALLTSGLTVWAWCVILFKRGRGTPVPFNPPRELVVAGPYAWVRNPMLTGVFASLFGLGFLLHSISMVFVWTPAFVLLNAVELKLVEEPELERRFGESYREYRRRVPRFAPRVRGLTWKDSSLDEGNG